MDNSLVSIVVPIYNVEKYIEKLICSVVAQTYSNFELILIDDGSPDESGKICDQYANKDPRIKIIHKDNEGVSAARNDGIKIAKGKYITFIDGDDWIEPDFTAYMLNLIENKDSDMAMTDRIFTTRDRKQIETDNIAVISAEEATKMILYPYMSVGCWNKIYKTEFLRKNDIYFKVVIGGEGLYFSATAAQHANHVGLGHRKVYNYRLNNANSAVTSNSLKIGLYCQKSVKAVKDELFLETEGIKRAVNWHIWRNEYYVLYLLIASKTKKENYDLYKTTKKNLAKMFWKVLIQSELGLKTKTWMFFEGLFPVLCCKIDIKHKKKQLEQDKME